MDEKWRPMPDGPLTPVPPKEEAQIQEIANLIFGCPSASGPKIGLAKLINEAPQPDSTPWFLGKRG
jgi:hypothetical protein